MSHIAEYLAALENYGAMSVDILNKKKILILHSGGTNFSTPSETICGEVNLNVKASLGPLYLLKMIVEV